MVTIRYEVTTCCLFAPFQVGFRHLVVATCKGSPDNLNLLARERYIYRPQEGEYFQPLSFGSRVKHGMLGLMETLGYLTLLLPFITHYFDILCNYNPYYNLKPRGSQEQRVHVTEGGNYTTETNHSLLRKNPFDSNALQDPFYRGAYWARA